MHFSLEDVTAESGYRHCSTCAADSESVVNEKDNMCEVEAKVDLEDGSLMDWELIDQETWLEACPARSDPKSSDKRNVDEFLWHLGG
jgi:hypothetical protein